MIDRVGRTPPCGAWPVRPRAQPFRVDCAAFVSAGCGDL